MFPTAVTEANLINQNPPTGVNVVQLPGCDSNRAYRNDFHAATRLEEKRLAELLVVGLQLFSSVYSGAWKGAIMGGYQGGGGGVAGLYAHSLGQTTHFMIQQHAIGPHASWTFLAGRHRQSGTTLAWGEHNPQQVLLPLTPLTKTHFEFCACTGHNF